MEERPSLIRFDLSFVQHICFGPNNIDNQFGGTGPF